MLKFNTYTYPYIMIRDESIWAASHNIVRKCNCMEGIKVTPGEAVGWESSLGQHIMSDEIGVKLWFLTRFFGSTVPSLSDERA